MNKPNDYDNVQAYGDFTPLELGGHIMEIKKVEETKSKKGNDMLMIYLDTAKSDKQSGYYGEQFKNDIRPEKKWGCIVYQLVQDKDGNTHRGLKTFHTCVENSNPGFQVAWGNGYANCFKGKLIGGVFGQEEYLNASNEVKKSTKCRFFRSVDAIKEGVEVPELRQLPPGSVRVAPTEQPGSDGFMNIPEGLDEELPFN